MKSEFVFSENYDIDIFGIEKIHPFDGKKYGRAWRLFRESIGNELATITLHDQLADDEFLLLGHLKEYIGSLTKASNIAQVVEISLARFLPSKLLQKKLLKPARSATYGTWLATQKCLAESKVLMNFSGGYHHAYCGHGEGFCFFSDAALSILHARREKLLNIDDEVIMIDLDAHRGNGFESFFTKDPHVKIFDMYNFQTYPGMHPGDIDDFPFMVPLRAGMSGDEYLSALKEELPTFLTSLNAPKIAFYNAGTDILTGDVLGGLNVSFDDVVERDRYIINELVSRNIPTVVMTSGGYSKDSYKLVAKLAEIIFDRCN